MIAIESKCSQEALRLPLLLELAAQLQAPPPPLPFPLPPLLEPQLLPQLLLPPPPPLIGWKRATAELYCAREADVAERWGKVKQQQQQQKQYWPMTCSKKIGSAVLVM